MTAPERWLFAKTIGTQALKICRDMRRRRNYIPFAAVNLRQATGFREGWHKHHIIPQKAERDGELRAFLESLQLSGFQIDDFETNGLLLPAFPSIARAAGLPAHTIGHDQYNLMVCRQMQMIRIRCERIGSAALRKHLALASMRALQNALFNATQRHGFGSLGDIVLPLGATGGDLHATIGPMARCRAC